MSRLAFFLAFVVGCGGGTPPSEPVPTEPVKVAEPLATATAPVVGADHKIVDWVAPDEATIPAGPFGDSIKNGLELFTKTDVLLPEYVPSNMQCSSCHLDKGRQRDAVPMVGAYARFPKYMERTGATITLQDRVNYCFTRSLAGSRLPMESKEMTDIVNYIAWLSQGIPVGTHLEGEVLPQIKEKVEGDAARGEKLFTDKGCVVCHQIDGAGIPGSFPSLWGPRSYSIGASMAREERAASFILRFMPKTAPGTLSMQEAFDLSAFINSHPRPDSPMKENDFPTGGAQYDVPYATFGHEPYRPPAVLLERAKPELSVVPMPPSVRGTTP